ncbi:MAG: MFS transporter [Oscillospiraceae bacterium]|nr:MFS transporter [Oscillospiraceae bacterium]
MKKKATPLGGRTWAALLIFGLFGQIAWVIENMYFNVFLYNTISGDTSMIAAMVGWSAVTATVTTLIMGALSDKLGRRKAFIVGGYLLWGVSIAVFALVRTPAAAAAHGTAVLVVLLDCVMTFFGSTANDAAFNAWVTDVTTEDNRGRTETVLAIMPLIAMLVVFGALDGLTQSGSWPLFFLIVGGLTMLGGLVGLFVLKEPAGLKRADGSYFADILYGLRPSVVKANPLLYLSLCALGVYSISQQVYMPYLIIYIQRFLGITDYTMLLAGVLIVSSVVSVAVGKTVDRVGKLPSLWAAAPVGTAGLVLMYFARSQWAVLGAGIVMLGGGMVILACCNGLIRDYTPENMAGRFQGIRIIFQVLIPMVTGPYLGVLAIRSTGMTYDDLGTVKEVPTPGIFLMAAAVLLLIFAVIALLGRRKGKEAAR